MRYESTQKEEFSRAYVTAIAAAAGCSWSIHTQDRHSVDLTIVGAHEYRPKVDVQVKATAARLGDGATFSFPLKKKNYDDLRQRASSPRLLIIVSLPQAEDEWVEHHPSHLLLRHCSYFYRLDGADASDNTTSVSLSIPKSNEFTVAALRQMLDDIVNCDTE